jgi:hypothetical protein
MLNLFWDVGYWSKITKLEKQKRNTKDKYFFSIDFFGNMKKMQCIRKQLENLILVKKYLGEFWENDCKYIE